MSRKSISPNPKAYNADSKSPEALEREEATRRQVRWDTDTIIWGEEDALPLRILMAVNQSPTATSCLGKKESFIKGSGFTDEGLMTMPINEDGTTLWELNCQLATYDALLESYAVNFQFDRTGKISETFTLGVESCRFTKPADGSKKIIEIKHNPYFGTVEFNQRFTKCYPVFDMAAASAQIKAFETGKIKEYSGQIYFYGTTRPPYKFYSVPKYWSGEEWIYVDGNIQKFHKSNLDNGFFQSALMNVIGDPNQKSKNPVYMTEVTGEDNVKRKVSTKTVGQEFDEQMNKTFSGSRKAGTAMVLWSLNKDQAVTVQAFPVNTQFDVLSGTFTDAMRGITTATEVPAILANLPQQASSLGSDGNAIKAAIDLMQSNVAGNHNNRENFFNNIMLPNLNKKTKAQVKIKNYIPITTAVTVEDKFWEVLTPDEKKAFVKTNIPGMAEVIVDTPQPTDEEGTPISPEEKKLNDNLTNLTGRQLQQLRRISRQFDKEEITLDQAKLQLQSGFGFSDEEVNLWLGI